MSEDSIKDLRIRLGKSKDASIDLMDQLKWAQMNHDNEPQTPWRLRVYNLLADHDIQLDWMGVEKSIMKSMLEELDFSLLRESLSVGKLREFLVDLGGWQEAESSINYWLNRSDIIERIVGPGSRNPFHQPALTTAECESAFDKGMRQAEWEVMMGSHWVGLRILNPAVRVFAAMQLFMHAGVPFQKSLEPLVVKDRLESISYVAEKSVRRHPMSQDPLMGLTFFGGYELAYSVGFICKMASEGRFTLMSGLEAYAAAFVAELIQEGSANYVTFAQRAPDEWIDENKDAFDLPSVFQAAHPDPADVQLRLALFHLHSSLNA